MARKTSRYGKAISVVLARLRKSHREYQDAGRFSKDSEVAPSTVAGIEKGSIMPTLPIIEAWLTACDVSLSQFFTDVEIEAGVSRPNHPRNWLEFLPGRDRLYAMLTTILRCEKNERRIDGITVNLEEFSQAAEREMREDGLASGERTRASPLKPPRALPR